MRVFASVCAVCVLAAAPVSAAPAPRVSVDSLADLEVPDAPFEAGRNADGDIDAALARARTSGKRVLIDLGGNWCADCRILAGLMDLPEMERFLDAHYEVVNVDVGRFNRNLQIPARYGIPVRRDGVPAILIVDAGGRLLNAGHTSAIQDARRFTPQALADWLAQWTT
jgi:hypothetical protein